MYWRKEKKTRVMFVFRKKAHLNLVTELKFLATNKDSAYFSNISLHSYSSTPNQSTVLKLAVNGTWGTACADTGANNTIAGETLYRLKDRANFQKTRLSMSLADGQKSEVEVYITRVVNRLEGRVIRTPLIALPYAKGN
ncbi:hypothetical protein NPIL_22791 [Nephila pilipes]|uniref:Uncharacterized protein n=1 Tax=Nephila pilipes TaxID=299642 RepID=A0A8X6K949_NEPPI|nr:hypothetical protein NPIL_22791 [Nephila pilipes]